MGLLDLEEFVSRETERGNRADTLGKSLARGLEQNPDEYAKALKLAAKTGVAPSWAKEFGQVIERQRKTDPFAVDDLVRRNPKTAGFLADPDNASVAHDDVENMSGIERALSYIVNPLRSFAAGFIDTPAQLVYGGLRAGADVQSTIIGRPLASVVKGLTGYEMADPFERMSRDFAELQRQSTAQRERIKGDLSKEHPLVQAAYSGFESAGGTLASLPYTLITGGPGAMLGLMAGSSGGRSYGEARQKGVPVEQALTYAGSQALIEYATELIPAKALIRDLGLHTNILKTLGNQIWRENIGEQVATALQDLNEWAILNPEKPFKDYLAERPSAALQTFVATMVGTTVQTAAAKGMDTAMMGQEHRANRRVFEALGQLSQESMLRSRIPEKFRNFIEQATEDGPVKDVLVPVEQFERYFQTQEMDPATVAGQLGAANYLEAKLAGTDVAIPIAEFAEKIAPTPHLTGLAEDLRLKPGELTEREAKENAEAFKAEQTERANKILEQQAEAQPLETAIQLITENVQAQLEAAGMEPSTARDQAAVMRGIAVVASRANPDMNPLQAAAKAWERYGLSIQSPAYQPENVDVEAARRDAETLAKLREAGPIGRTDQQAVGAAIDDHIRAMAATEGGVTYQGKTYEKAVKDGNNLKLLSGDEEITVRGAEIMKVEEAVPFDVPASDYVKRFFQAVYHGSPHTFDQFSLEKIGTGEGAQTFGFGLYFAQNPAVAEEYQKRLSVNERIAYTVDGHEVTEFEKLVAARIARDADVLKIENYDEWAEREAVMAAGSTGEVEKILDYAKQFRGRANYERIRGNLYTVEIPDEVVAKMLDWDKPIGEQAEILEVLNEKLKGTSVMRALTGGNSDRIPLRLFGHDQATGRDLYQALSGTGNMRFGSGKAGASMLLNSLGIPGIKYLDQFSRNSDAGYKIVYADGKESNTHWKTKAEAQAALNASERQGRDVNGATIEFVEDTTGTRNLVVFDPSVITEVKRNGEVVSKAEAKRFFQSSLSDKDAAMPRKGGSGQEPTGTQAPKPEGGKNKTRRAYQAATERFTPDDDYTSKQLVAMKKRATAQLVARGIEKKLAIELKRAWQRNNDLSKALRFIAAETITDEARIVISPSISEIVKARRPELERFIAAQHAATQKWLKTRGIQPDDFVVLYRGMTGIPWEKTDETAKVIELEFDGITSFSFGLDDFAELFTADNGGIGGKVLIAVKIPARDIFALPKTGLGSVAEQEVISFGGVRQVLAVRADDGLTEFGRDALENDELIPLNASVIPRPNPSSPPSGGGQEFSQEDDDLKGKRASIEISPDRKVTINLLENRDLSSFLHETGHLYLEVLGDFAAEADTSQQVKDDYATLLAFVGKKTRSEITTEDHEKIARAFEQYLREGKSPTVELRSVFQRFKAWLMMIYRQAKDLRVQLNDDVREVFDRLLASDQEIEFAKAQIETRPMFTDAKAAGMTEKEFALYTKAVGDEVETAKDKLQVQLMREYDREQSKQYKAEIAKVKKELEAEADALPIYTALAALSAGKLPDDSPVKLNRASVVQKYTKAIADKLPKKILANSGNLDAEAAASIFGFATGDDLIKAFAEMEPRQDYIDRRAVETMRERYGDIRTDGTIADRAVDALHNDQRAKVIRMELQAIRRRQNEVDEIKGPLDKARRHAARAAADVPSEKVFRDTARDIIQHIAVRNLEPYRYLQAERRASRGAINAMAAEDFETAADNKRQELLSHYLYMEAEKAREEADDILEYARKFEQRKARESLGKAGADYLAQVDHLLNRYEFRKVPITQLERRQALSEWIQSQIDDGLEPSIDERLLDETRRTNYRDVSIDELRAVRDALRNIEHLSRLKNKLVYRKAQADFRDAKDALIASAEGNFDREPLPFSKDAETLRERGADALKGFDAGLIKPERLFMWLDGNDVNGPWHQYVWNPLKESQHHENDLTKTITTKLVAALEKMPKKQRETMHDTFHVDGIGRLTRKDIISIAFNRGNAENLDKMLRGMQWNQAIVDSALAKLNAADWKFVQDTWDIINELWPEIAELQKRTTGLEPKKVEPLAFKAYDEQGNEIADLEGGYFPLVYDSRFSSAGKRQEMGGGLGQIFEEGYVRATTPKGHTQERTGFAAPLLFDFEAVITSHIAKVIRDVTHRESIVAANKILSDQEIRSVLQETLGEAYEQTMYPWLRYIANERNRSIADGLSTWERLFTAGRANTVAAIMGFKATTILSQLLGLSNSMDAVKPSYLASALSEYVRNSGETTRTVNELSGEMRHRADTMDRDINQRLRHLIGKQSPLVAVQRYAYHGIAAMDSIVARVTWLGAYRQALAEGKDAETAINSGDAAVRLTQGSGSSMDLAAIQRSRDNFWRATTMFYSFFSALYSQGRDIGFQVEGKGDLPRALSRYFFAFVVPALLGDLIVLRGPDDDKDESWAWWAARKAMIQPLMTVPLLRDLASHFDSGYDIRITPITAVYEKLTRLVDRAYKDQVDGNDIDFLKYAENVAETVGYVFGVPGTAQVMGTGRYLRRVGEGEEDPDNLLQLIYEAGIGKRRD